MIIGVPKEIKNNENRVSLTPAGASLFVAKGHQVLVQAQAGAVSGFADDEYEAEGARIVGSAAEAWAADMVMKVKEPLKEEYAFFRPNLVLFTYLHLAPEPELTWALVENRVSAIAYETIQLDNGALPLLTPMSEIAGRMSVQIGAQLLENSHGGKGILLSGVPGVAPAEVVIIGGGVVGTNAAQIAIGMGASVTLLDISPDRLRQLEERFGARLRTRISNGRSIEEAVKGADLLIGAVLVPGARAPRLVTEQMVKGMRPGSVIVDVAIDQGGSIETIDRVTTHSDPTYVKHGVVHYAVANMPGAVSRTSTVSLTNVTLPYALRIAEDGIEKALRSDKALARGVNTMAGFVTYRPVADSHGYACRTLDDALGQSPRS
ncbi:alanine dehydrogenase [Cohnella sp. GCM10020058]|uniref:alanine dehydrogenase n=1 Tax=Cohnella sp. GCM10020058 TaxID=3317330 RepID=UPI00362E9691